MFRSTLIAILGILLSTASVYSQDYPSCVHAPRTILVQSEQDFHSFNEISKAIKQSVLNRKKRIGSILFVDKHNTDQLHADFWSLTIKLGENAKISCNDTELCTNYTAYSILDEIQLLKEMSERLSKISLRRTKIFKRVLRRFLYEQKGYSLERAKRLSKRRARKRFVNPENDLALSDFNDNIQSALTNYISEYGMTRYQCDNSVQTSGIDPL